MSMTCLPFFAVGTCWQLPGCLHWEPDFHRFKDLVEYVFWVTCTSTQQDGKSSHLWIIKKRIKSVLYLSATSSLLTYN